jgi:hypothetical protein
MTNLSPVSLSERFPGPDNEGGMTITFDWDDTDPVFDPKVQMTEHEQCSFMLTAISSKLPKNLDNAS